MRRPRLLFALGMSLSMLGLLACSRDDKTAQGGMNHEQGRTGRSNSKSGMAGGSSPGGFGARQEQQAAVPVQVERIVRRDISQYLETNGVLEAENEVDVVSRVSGPIVELSAEEGMQVKKGQVLARIDERDIRVQVEISQVNLTDAQLNFDRAKVTYEEELITQQDYDQAFSRLESAKAQVKSNRIQLEYTTIRAPFDGVIVQRHVKLAQTVSANMPVLRISDFNPLLCPIQVPEKDLPRLHAGQPTHVNVDAYPGEAFEGKVLRISPVVSASSGTVKVTLELDGKGKLRPGMFASVFLVTDRHDKALVIPKVALVLESIGDTVFVHKDGRAERRNVVLGFREGDRVEVLDGLAQGEEVIVLGQDDLTDGTPVTVLGASASEAAAGHGPDARRGTGGRGAWGMDLSKMTPEQLEEIKQRMRDRGMSDAQIEERLKQMKERMSAPQAPPSGEAHEDR